MNMNIENQVKNRTYMHKSNENVQHENSYARNLINMGMENYGDLFDKVAEPLEEIARSNPALIPLLKIVRKGYEDMCQNIISENRVTHDNTHKLKQEVSNLRKDQSLLIKDKENAEREANRNYSLYKKAKEEALELQNCAKELELYK